MRPLDHFLSKLASLESSLGLQSARNPAASLPPQDRNRLEQDFSHLIAPVLGAAAAADLYNRILDSIAQPMALRKLGAMAAFFLGEYDEKSVLLERTALLERDDWQTIKETLEDVSGEMDINTLTTLMGELLSRGILD